MWRKKSLKPLLNWLIKSVRLYFSSLHVNPERDYHCSVLRDSVGHKGTHFTDELKFSWSVNIEGAKKGAPVCVLLCLCSSSLRVNLFPQNIQLQTKGLSPECQRRCARRCDVFPYTFPQPAMWQMCCFFFPMLDPLKNTGPDNPGLFISNKVRTFRYTHSSS